MTDRERLEKEARRHNEFREAALVFVEETPYTWDDLIEMIEEMAEEAEEGTI